MTMQRFALGLVIGACIAVGTAGPVTAQAQQAQPPRTLEVSFNNGLVTIVGSNVTIREILVEWGRKGGSRIVNAEKLAGQVLPYIEFRDEPEIVVLRSLLREVPGYGAAPRIAPSPDASTIETVYLLATRSVPVSNAPVSSSVSQPQVQQVQQPPVQNFAPEGFQPPPQPEPRVIPGSPDAEIPPVRPVAGELPPTTPGSNAQPTDPNLRTGPGGTVTSTIPGVIIPGTTQTGPPGSGGTTPPPGRGRGGGGGGGSQR